MGHVDDNYAAYAADSDATPVPEDTIGLLRRMGMEQLDCEAAVLDAALRLKEAQDNLYDVQCRRIPDLMERHLIPSFSFVGHNGTYTITLRADWRVTMPPLKDKQGNEYPESAAKRTRIFEWLERIGEGGAIDKEARFDFGRVPDEQVFARIAVMQQAAPDAECTYKKDIHQKRLEGMVRRMKKAGKDVHEDVVCTPIRESKIAVK